MSVRHRFPKPLAALLFPPPVLHRRYSIELDIGHGGNARVFRAWDAYTAQLVAIKRAHLSQQSEAMLQAEAECLAGLHHPGIPAFIEYFEEVGRCYRGDAWRSGTPMCQMRYFAFPQVLWIGHTLGDVLAYLHHCDLVHGDLTPGNVLLENEALSLIDFGCAGHASDPPQLKGTPGYAAPEQWDEGQRSAAGDVFSLGMLLGCVLTDSQPEEVQRAGSFSNLWDDPARLPAELLPLLALLDRMIALSAAARPGLVEVQDMLRFLEHRLGSSQR